MSNDEQTRDSIGQYSYKPQSYPEVQLAENVDASFLFPPSTWPGGVEQYLEFWRTQPISDEALTNFASAYAAERDDWAENEAGPAIREAMENWGNSFEALELKKQGYDAMKVAREAYADQVAAEWDASYPPRIANSLVRYVARAAQMRDNIGRLNTEEEKETVLNTVLYHNKAGEPVTVEEVWNGFRLGAIMPDAFYSRENEVSRRVRELTDRLVQITN